MSSLSAPFASSVGPVPAAVVVVAVLVVVSVVVVAAARAAAILRRILAPDTGDCSRASTSLAPPPRPVPHLAELRGDATVPVAFLDTSSLAGTGTVDLWVCGMVSGRGRSAVILSVCCVPAAFFCSCSAELRNIFLPYACVCGCRPCAARICSKRCCRLRCSSGSRSILRIGAGTVVAFLVRPAAIVVAVVGALVVAGGGILGKRVGVDTGLLFCLAAVNTCCLAPIFLVPALLGVVVLPVAGSDAGCTVSCVPVFAVSTLVLDCCSAVILGSKK